MEKATKLGLKVSTRIGHDPDESATVSVALMISFLKSPVFQHEILCMTVIQAEGPIHEVI